MSFVTVLKIDVENVASVLKLFLLPSNCHNCPAKLKYCLEACQIIILRLSKLMYQIVNVESFAIVLELSFFSLQDCPLLSQSFITVHKWYKIDMTGFVTVLTYSYCLQIVTSDFLVANPVRVNCKTG